MRDRLPLSVLLSGVLLAFVEAFERGDDPPPRIEVWANVLQYGPADYRVTGGGGARLNH